MPKKKTLLGELAGAVTEILESAADVVDGSIFGEKKEDNGTDGKSRKQQDNDSTDVQNGGSAESDDKRPKPPKPSDTFKPAPAGKKEGEAGGDSKQAEGSGKQEAS